jgi:hypothetical protein
MRAKLELVESDITDLVSPVFSYRARRAVDAGLMRE